MFTLDDLNKLVFCFDNGLAGLASLDVSPFVVSTGFIKNSLYSDVLNALACLSMGIVRALFTLDDLLTSVVLGLTGGRLLRAPCGFICTTLCK